MEVLLDGKRVQVPEGSRLSDLLPDRDPRFSVAVIRPVLEEEAESQEVRFVTTAGDMVVEVADPALVSRIFAPGLAEKLRLHWHDRYTAAFGPFESGVRPAREPGRYERGDVILGCGGYDPARSYLIFSRMRHTADHGAAADGGVIGRVVTGRGLLDRIGTGDRITAVERILRRADRSHAVVTRDGDFPLEDSTQVVSYVEAAVQGWESGNVDTGAARSVEHFLLSVKEGRFQVGRSTSTHVVDTHLVPAKVPLEFSGPRLEGAVTVRTAGKSSGAVYIYTQGVSASAAHTVVGRVIHGIELVRFAGEGDLLAIRAEPEKFDLIGFALAEAEAVAARRGVTLTSDETGGDRVVVGQTPATTLEVLAAGAVKVTTEPPGAVISITLDEAAAPRSVTIFREATGLKHHDVGKMPLVFRFEDVSLFKPKIGKGIGIIPENVPTGEVPAFTLAMTNDSRRGAGMVGVRAAPNAEFGPTSEPLTGTNIIGKVLDAEKLEQMREGTTVYVREVK
ncbi:methanogenesis marker 3 protein [Methanoculleus bourgensis]|nr:methanogenesis marker 3 protein [Methanoculleus bourgensis]GLI45843.1 methanogenesis marker 3 protein [Methanoculleus bourgensis]